MFNRTDRHAILTGVAMFAVIVLAVALIPHITIHDGYLLHPLGGAGYQFFSGIGSSISEWLTILFAITVYVYHHNCHQHRCLRLAWHPDKDGHPTCKVHNPDHPARGWLRNDRTHPRHAVAKRLRTIQKGPNPPDTP
jgi:hypothetical protein